VIAWLRTRADIDGSRIALAGHSEGGAIAPMVAASDPKVRAIALLAGPAYDGRRILMFQQKQGIEREPGLSAAQRDSLLKTIPSQVDLQARNSPWVAYFLTYDPLPTARRVKQPVLILQGETDRQVSPEQADTLAATFRASGNRNVTLRKLPATNHLFLDDPSGYASGYAALKNSHVRREMLGALADWLVTTLK
jgi:fermentation-respiration switch protein FrsA (DUF1100 family)